MKAVLLTCNTGQGHNSAAAAVIEALERRGAVCETADALAFLGERVSEVLTGAFVNIAVHTPRAFGFMYQAADQISSDKIKSPVYYANTLYADNLNKYLTEKGFDVAICPHLFPAEALTYLRKRRDLKTKCFFVLTDYTCIPFLEETDMDAVFLSHADIAEECRERGVPADLLVGTGIPVSSRFLNRMTRSKAREELGFEQDVPVFLIMTGGEGCGDAVSMTRLILQRCNDRKVRVAVICGRNEGLFKDMHNQFGYDSRVSAVGFTERISTYIAACSVLMTKPGGISSTEAAVFGVPMIHTPPIPGCETKNAQFFSQRGMSIMATDAENAAFHAVRLAEDHEQAERIIQAQRQYINPRAADDISEYIFNAF